MLPALADGDLVLVDPGNHDRPDIGQIVVAPDPQDEERSLIKRVRSHGEHTLALGSDNPAEGRDSRHFGSIPCENIVGPATLVWRWGRDGVWFVALCTTPND